MAWTEHTSSSGRPFFYNPATGASVWERPAGISEARVFSRDTPPTLRACMATDRRVRALAGAIVRRCGVDALPRVPRCTAHDAHVFAVATSYQQQVRHKGDRHVRVITHQHAASGGCGC